MDSRSRPRCPTCGGLCEDQNTASKPFCSERCKLIDLGRWLSEDYRVPSYEEPPEEALLGDLRGEDGEN